MQFNNNLKTVVLSTYWLVLCHRSCAVAIFIGWSGGWCACHHHRQYRRDCVSSSEGTSSFRSVFETVICRLSFLLAPVMLLGKSGSREMLLIRKPVNNNFSCLIYLSLSAVVILAAILSLSTAQPLAQHFQRPGSLTCMAMHCL